MRHTLACGLPNVRQVHHLLQLGPDVLRCIFECIEPSDVTRVLFAACHRSVRPYADAVPGPFAWQYHPQRCMLHLLRDAAFGAAAYLGGLRMYAWRRVGPTRPPGTVLCVAPVALRNALQQVIEAGPPWAATGPPSEVLVADDGTRTFFVSRQVDAALATADEAGGQLATVITRPDHCVWVGAVYAYFQSVESAAHSPLVRAVAAFGDVNDAIVATRLLTDGACKTSLLCQSARASNLDAVCGALSAGADATPAVFRAAAAAAAPTVLPLLLYRVPRPLYMPLYIDASLPLPQELCAACDEAAIRWLPLYAPGDARLADLAARVDGAACVVVVARSHMAHLAFCNGDIKVCIAWADGVAREHVFTLPPSIGVAVRLPVPRPTSLRGAMLEAQDVTGVYVRVGAAVASPLTDDLGGLLPTLIAPVG